MFTYHSLWFWWSMNKLSSSLFSLAGTNEVMRLIISRNLLQNSWHGWIGEYFLLFTDCTCVGLTAIQSFILHSTRHMFGWYFFQNKWIRFNKLMSVFSCICPVIYHKCQVDPDYFQLTMKMLRQKLLSII